MSGDPTSHQTVRDALRIAAVLRGPAASAADAADVLARVIPCMAPAAARAAREEMTAAPAMGRARLLALVAPVLVRVHLPVLSARLMAVLRGLEEEPDAITCAGAFAVLRDAVRRAEPAADLAHATGPLARAVHERALACTQTLAATLRTADAPDVGALSNDLLRLDALRWIVEVLGDRRAEEELAHLSRRLARITLTRATATIDAFLGDRGLLTLFDNAAVITRVDDLIVVATRLLDALAAGEDEPTAFVETADETALQDFLRALALLSDALFALVLKSAAKAQGNDVFFHGLLRQIECLHRFLQHLRHERRPAQLQGIEGTIDRRLDGLTDRVVAELEDAVGNDRDTGPLLLARAEALLDMLERTGCGRSAGALGLRVRIARRALGGKP